MRTRAFLAMAVLAAQQATAAAQADRLIVSRNPCLIFACPGTIPDPPPIVTAGEQFPIYVAAMNANGQRDLFFSGTVSFGTSDQRAVMPLPYTFAPSDTGGKAFTVVMATPGLQTISVSSAGLAGGSYQLTVLEPVQPIPTLSEIGFVLLALSIALVGLGVLRRPSI